MIIILFSVPSKVTGLGFERKRNEVKCSWKEPKIVPKEYLIQFWQDGQLIHSSFSSGTEFIEKKLQPAGGYGFRVAASNKSGQGEWSDMELFKTG